MVGIVPATSKQVVLALERVANVGDQDWPLELP